MHVLAGKYKKKLIKTPILNAKCRPTKSIVREALFNIVDIFGLKFLDLCAGSGSVGIEALSRGASFVTFIEKNHANFIKHNLINLNDEKIIDQVMLLDFDIESLPISFIVYDVVYFDPPYLLDKIIIIKVINILCAQSWLTNNCLLFLELAKNDIIEFDSLQIVSSRNYGNTTLTQYRLN